MYVRVLSVWHCAPLRRTRLFAITGLLLAAPAPTRGEPVAIETRAFQISVDGERCGTYRLQVAQHSDGRHVVTGDASLELRYFLYTFRYTSQGSETWHSGKLESLENAARYGGSQYRVKAQRLGDQLLVKANNDQQRLPGNAWVTSYWHEPAPTLVGRELVLLDADKGRKLSGKLQLVGSEPLTLSGKTEQCKHYRLAGDVDVHVWYDGQSRLVRQESVESGHRTQIVLSEIRQQ